MRRWFTRRNPVYLLILTLLQLLLGAAFLFKGEMFWGAFFFWASGFNAAFLLYCPEKAPDTL